VPPKLAKYKENVLGAAGPLNTKRVPMMFKKGYGAVGLGRHTKKGFFHINPMLVPELHVPDLKNFELLPYVSRKTPVINGARGYWKGGLIN
jgi:hypothetical protein